MEIVGDILTGALRREPFTFERLIVATGTPRFDPGPLGVVEPAPSWDDFAPVRPGMISRVFRAGRYGGQLSAARARFADAETEHQRADAERRRALAAAKAKYDRKVTEHRAKAVRRNALVAARQAAFAAGDPAAVEWFAERILAASPYPKDFPRSRSVSCQGPEVTVEFELPREQVLAGADYEWVTACIALRTLHEIFHATPAELVATVVFNGWVVAPDPATGQLGRADLLSVRAERAAFGALNLAEVDPVACVGHLRRALGLGSGFGGIEHFQQPAQRHLVGTDLTGQRRPVVRLELAGHVVVPVLHDPLPGIGESAQAVVVV
jgi:restriction system protein